eukprot:g62971.t1
MPRSAYTDPSCPNRRRGGGLHVKNPTSSGADAREKSNRPNALTQDSVQPAAQTPAPPVLSPSVASASTLTSHASASTLTSHASAFSVTFFRPRHRALQHSCENCQQPKRLHD